MATLSGITASISQVNLQDDKKGKASATTTSTQSPTSFTQSTLAAAKARPESVAAVSARIASAAPPVAPSERKTEVPDRKDAFTPGVALVGPFSPQDLGIQMAQRSVRTLQYLVADSQNRMAQYSKNFRLLNQGFFYGNEYMKALLALNQQTRYKWFLKKGSFYHGFTSSKYFEMTPKKNTPSGVIGGRFVLKKGYTPSEALDSLNTTLTFIGCGEIVDISQYQALREILGDQKFDVLFAADSLTPLIIHSNSNDCPLKLCLSILKPTQKIVFRVGQYVHFANIPLYFFKHINGEAGGFNTLCIDATPKKERFVTLGLDTAGMTRAQIRNVLYREFNAPSVGMSIVSSEIARKIEDASPPGDIEFSKALKDVSLTEEQMNILSQGGFPESLIPTVEKIAKNIPNGLFWAKQLLSNCGQIAQVIELDMNRIYQLATSSTSEARNLFSTWYVQRQQELQRPQSFQ